MITSNSNCNKEKNNNLLSVVITTFNRCECLKLNLAEFCKQTDLHFEIVVAMDGCTDGTELMLKEYEKKAPFYLNWVDTGKTNSYGLGQARNMGIKAAAGDIIVILDDDSFPVVDFVKEHKRTVRNKTLTGGYRNSVDPEDKLHEKMKRYLKKYGSCKPQKLNSFVVENNCCMYRKDWIESGLFSEEDRGYGFVGQDFIARLIEKGFYYQFNPYAIIFHHSEFEGVSGLTREEKIAQSEKNRIYHKDKFKKKSRFTKRIIDKCGNIYKILLKNKAN